MAQQIGITIAIKAVEIGLEGIRGLVHGVGSVYNKLPSSETVSNTVQSLGNKIRQAQVSPTSITHDGLNIIEPFKTVDVSPESFDAHGIELLETGLLHSSKKQVQQEPIYDLEMGNSTEQIQWGNTSVIMDQSGRIYDSHYRELDLHMWNNGIVLHKNWHIVNDDSSSDEILLGDEILPGDV